MVSSVAVVVVCLVFLSRLMYCSMSALTLWGRTEVLASLSFHTDWRMIAVVRVMGRLVSGPTSPYSSLSAAPGCRPGIDCCRHCTSCCPTPLFLLQYRSSCSRVPSSEHPGILHSGERMVPILNNLDWVQSRFNILRSWANVRLDFSLDWVWFGLVWFRLGGVLTPILFPCLYFSLVERAEPIPGKVQA